MSIPSPQQVYGTLHTDTTVYEVLNRPLSETIRSRYQSLPQNRRTVASSAPWIFRRCDWRLVGKTLYLTKLFEPNLLKEFFGRDIICADWVKELVALEAAEHRISDGVADIRLHIRTLQFKQGVYIGSKKTVVSRTGVTAAYVPYYLGRQEGWFSFLRKDISPATKRFAFCEHTAFARLLSEDINAMIEEMIRAQNEAFVSHIRSAAEAYLYGAFEIGVSDMDGWIVESRRALHRIAPKGIANIAVVLYGSVLETTEKKIRRAYASVCSKIEVYAGHSDSRTETIGIQLWGGLR